MVVTYLKWIIILREGTMKMAKKKNAKQRREEEKNRLKAKIEKFKMLKF